MLRHRKYFKSQFNNLEKLTTEWALLHTQQGIPYYSSIANLISRTTSVIRASNQTNGFGALEQFPEIKNLLLRAHLGKLESTMKLLRKLM